MKPLDSETIETPSQLFKHGFVHSVYFWLKPELGEDEVGEFESALRLMVAESEFATTGHIGQPAGTDREVVDNSYDYSLIVTFDNAADHQAYQDEEPHDRFRVVAKKFALRVLIFDSQA
ncbi:MAG: Dabb family protein [Planctomycetota bacterium]